jgi:hypothetical protein
VVLHSEAADTMVSSTPFVVTTPYHRVEVGQRWPERLIVEVTLSLEAVRELRTRLELGPLAIIVASDTIAHKLTRAVERGQLTQRNANISVIVAQQPSQLLQTVNGYRTVFLWPGTPQWAREALNRTDCVTPVHCLSEDSITRVRSAVLDAAIRRAHEPGRFDEFTTSSVSEALAYPVGVG